MSEIKTIKTLIKMVISFLILISVGLSFDLYDKYNKYGWVYEETKIINGVTSITRIDLKNSIYFCIVFWVFVAITLESLILIDKLKFGND